MSSSQLSQNHSDDPTGFTCVLHAESSSRVRVVLGGELDLCTAPRLAEALSQVTAGAALVILDLSGLTFVDSTGLQVILNARAQLSAAGGRLVLVPGGPQVRRIFEITGIARRFEFASSADHQGLAGLRLT
jgi:anti-sigma B factor antagonist